MNAGLDSGWGCLRLMVNVFKILALFAYLRAFDYEVIDGSGTPRRWWEAVASLYLFYDLQKINVKISTIIPHSTSVLLKL